MGAALLLLGCGGKQEAKTPLPVAVAPPQTLVEDEAPDLSPVGRPAELVVTGHVARPRLLAETLAKWSSVPLSVEQMLPSETRAFSSAINWDAPIDLLVSLDPFGEGKLPPPLVVVSVGVASLEAGRNAAEALGLPLRRLAPGVFRVGDFGERSCALSASVGAAPARLVCGRTANDVDRLLPYATRGLPLEPELGADLEVALDAKPLQARYGAQVNALRLLAGVALREVSLDTPRFDRALSDALHAGIDEAIDLFGDLEQIRLQARLDAARSTLKGSAEVRLKGESSWLAGTLAAAKPVQIPATLPRLPPGTSFAMFASGQPAERFAAMGRVLADLAEGYLEYEKVPPATRRRARRVIEPWFSSLPESFGFALASTHVGRGQSAKLHPDTAVTRASEPAARLLGLYNDFYLLLGDPGFKKWVLSKAKLSAQAWPKLGKKALRIPGFKRPATVFEVVLDPKQWKDASPEVSRILPKLLDGAASDELLRMTWAVQPDDGFTYVALGEDSGEIAHALSEHRKDEPGAFFAHPASTEPVTAAGFFTLAYVARALERSAGQPATQRALLSAPQHGDTPIPFSSVAGPGFARLDIELPAAALTDATAMLLAATGAGSQLR